MKRVIKSENFKKKTWSLQEIKEAKIFHVSSIQLEEVQKQIAQITIKLISIQTIDGKSSEIEEYFVIERSLLDKSDEWKFAGILEKDKEYSNPTAQELFNYQ
jgi:hypothetical protein